jgi:hypothetical protein
MDNLPNFIKPIKVVSVTSTLQALEVDQSTLIKYADAKPSTVLSTASRVPEKTFHITVKGQKNATLITRIS